MTEENTLKNEGTKVYEVGYLLLPNIEESKVREESLKIRDIIENNKGLFLSEGSAEMKALTYPMAKAISGRKQKFEEAYFGWIKFEGNSDMVTSVKTELDKYENILRFILITTVKENTIMPSKSGKFSFDKKEKDDNKEEEKDIKKDEEKEVVKEVKEDKKVKEADEKALDDTIDELVIE